MNKKVLLLTICYIIGNIWGLYFNKNIAPFFVFFAVVLLCFSKKRKCVLILSCIVIISCCRALIKNNQYAQMSAYGEEMVVEGMIVESQSDGKLLVEISSVNDNKINYKARMKVYSKNCNVQVGENIKAWGNFSVGTYARNEGTFDYKRYQQSKCIVRLFEG